MADYYGVIRSEKHIKHYGVRGMRWGVRKAIERGDRQALQRHYQKAARKLAKLSMNANRDVETRRYKAAKTRMISGALQSAVGSAGITAGANAARGVRGGALGRITSVAALGGAVGGALLNSKGIMAGRHISDKGHAKAVRKRDEFAKEFESAFKNTEVAPKGKEFHRQIQQVTAISNQKDPAKYVMKQAKKVEANRPHAVYMKTEKNGALSTNQSHIKDPALRKKAETYAKHYNSAISKGMDRHSASSYANTQLSTGARRRRRR